MRKLVFLLGVLLLGLALLSGCSSGGSATGTARVYLTDQPASPYSSVFVTFTRLDLVAHEAGPVTIWTGRQQVDLLALDNVQLLLALASSVPVGEYDQLRLVLSSEPGDNYVVMASDQSHQNLLLSSQAQTGLKLVGRIPIAEGQITNLLIDFDAARSVVEEGNGQLRLKPVINLATEGPEVPEAELGEIAGMLAPTAALPTARISVVHEATGLVMTTATVRQDTSTGAFLPDFEVDVPPGTYSLRITADGYQTYDSAALSPPQTWVVVADQTTDVGTITLNPAP